VRGTVAVALFLPDRRALLQFVDRVLAGGERRASMCRRNRDRDRRLA
jgi:hypothetical protein